MSKLHKLKAPRGIQDALNARNGLNTIQTLSLALSLGKFEFNKKRKDRQNHLKS